MKKEPKWLHPGWRVAEVALFLAALFLISPAPPSAAGVVHSVWPTLLWGGLFFATHVGIRVSRQEDSLISAAVRFAGYSAMIVIAHESVRFY